MPREMIVEYLALSQEEEKLRLRLVMEIAPLLKGVKQSCIMVVPEENLSLIRKQLSGTNIKCVMLHKSGSKKVIILYRERTMEAYLQKENVRKFLRNYGYMGSSLSDDMQLLRRRMACFYEKSQTFPHEIGIFLGYPVEDVKGFIENTGKNYLLSGYWKVYSDIQVAEHLFQQFDEARENGVRAVLAGKQLHEIAC